MAGERNRRQSNEKGLGVDYEGHGTTQPLRKTSLKVMTKMLKEGAMGTREGS